MKNDLIDESYEQPKNEYSTMSYYSRRFMIIMSMWYHIPINIIDFVILKFFKK